MALESAAFGIEIVELVGAGFAFGSASIGLYIAYLAFESFNRHDDASMRYLAMGLILLTGVTYTFTFLGSALLHLRMLSVPQQDVFRTVAHVVQFAGLVCIAYALHRRP